MLRTSTACFTALALVVSGLPPRAAIAEDAIVLSERTPIAFLLSTPTGQIGNAKISDIIRIAQDTVKAHTNLYLQEVDEHVAKDCKGKPGYITCLVTQVRAHYNREALMNDEGKIAPCDAYLRQLKQQ